LGDSGLAGILIVDKPSGWTSFDVCAKLRGAARHFTGSKKIKIGHGGTLDPIATGVLPVFISREFTKQSFMGESADKEYMTGLRLGVTTDTQDVTGNITGRSIVNISRAQLQAAINSFRGELSQIPPMYSAIHVNGRRLYDIARSGAEISREPRLVTIHDSELISFENDFAVVRFVVSKGTYIRTLCSDIGAMLGCGGVMETLRRTRVGKWTIEQSHTMDRIMSHFDSGDIENLLAGR